MNDNEQQFDDVAMVRELARRAYPDAVAELIDGASAEEIEASIEPARAAYARGKNEIEAARPAAVAQVPAGGVAAGIDPWRRVRSPGGDALTRPYRATLSRFGRGYGYTDTWRSLRNGVDEGGSGEADE